MEPILKQIQLNKFTINICMRYKFTLYYLFNLLHIIIMFCHMKGMKTIFSSPIAINRIWSPFGNATVFPC